MELGGEEVYGFNDNSAEGEKGQIGYNQRIENEDFYDEEGNKLVKLCKICGKRFSSGRALGGHARIHFAEPKPDRPNKKLIFVNQNPMKKLTLLMNDTCDEKIKKPKNECVCCHKSFDSQKALYGHMRSHPEREYRGLVPPPLRPTPSLSPPVYRNYSSSNNSTLSQDEILREMDDDDDLIKACGADDDDSVSDAPLKWRCTGKRGRKTTLVSPISPVFSSEDEDERMNAVNTLMSFGSADKYDDSDNPDDDLFGKRKHREQVKKLNYLDEATGPSNCDDDQYKCRTCNKSFSSHQALGGHRSSHRKPLITIAQGKSTEFKVEAEVKVEADAEAGCHQCELCGKKFETGQALGGHKRCHRTINYPDVAPLIDQPVVVPLILGVSRHEQQALESAGVSIICNDTPLLESSQRQVVATPQARITLDFDLNEPAFVDDEDL